MTNDTTPGANGAGDAAALNDQVLAGLTDSSSTSDAATAEPEAPKPPSFDDLGLHPDVKQALDDMGYDTPTPVQTAVFGPVSAGKNLLVQSRTGTGKTTAFGLPLVNKMVPAHRQPQALILAPTRELALQVARELTNIGKHRGIVIEALYGGAPIGKQITALSNGVHIVVGTPGRVLDHIKRRTLDCKAISTFVLDECDEMLSMGFLEDIERVTSFLPEKHQTLLFSATMPDEVTRYARRHMPEREQISLSKDQVSVSDIHHAYYIVSGIARSRDLMKVILSEEPESAIIFCNMRDETTMVAKFLQKQGLDAEPLSSDLSQADRERVMGRMKAKNLRFLCATDVAARGIDISNLSHVINYSVPESPEVYVHRTGRTGRAGKKGTAISLVGPRELGNFRYVRLTFGIKPEERVLPKDDIFIGKLKVPLPPVGAPQPPDPIQILIRGVQGTASDLERSIFEKLLAKSEGKRVLAQLVADKLNQLTTKTSRPRRERTEGDRPEGGDRPIGDRPEGGERPRFDRDRGERGERPRFDRDRGDRPRFDRDRGGDRPEGGERPIGDRPEGGERPRFDRDRGERPRFGDRPEGGERPRFDRDRGERGDRPRFDRGDRPEGGERPAGDRPERTERPVGDRPEGGERPRFDRDRGGDRPERSDRPAGDRPAGDRPERSDRPAGDREERGERGERRFDRDRGDRPRFDRDRDRNRDRGERPNREERPAGDAAAASAAPVADAVTATPSTESTTPSERPARDERGDRGERRFDRDRGERGDRGGRDRGERGERRFDRDRDRNRDRGEVAVQESTAPVPVVETYEAPAATAEAPRAAETTAPVAAAEEPTTRDRGGKKKDKRAPEVTDATREFWETWAENKSTKPEAAPKAEAAATESAPAAGDSEERSERSERSGRGRGRDRDRGGRDRDRKSAKSDDRGERNETKKDDEPTERKETKKDDERPARGKRDTVTDAAPRAAAAADGNQARLFVSLGKKHGVSADDLRSLLAGPIGGDTSRIGSVSLRDSHAHVRVPEDAVDAIIGAVHGTLHNEHNVTVERARA